MSKFYYGIDPSAKRKLLLKSTLAKKYIEEVISNADKAISLTSEAFKMSDYLSYWKTGNRSLFEKPYFERRASCTSLAIAYWLSCDDKYLEPLIDYISYICDEFSWCVPAHSPFGFSTNSAQYAVECIDLFAAGTAALFSEIVMCVGDKLPEYILDRMKYEIHRRILPTLISGEPYWWENCKMNWATVCGAGCAIAVLTFADDEIKEQLLPKFVNCLDSYLEGIKDDGACSEGINYWGYGFGHFVLLAQIVKIHTNSELNYFENPKVKELAVFFQKVRMSEAKVAAFADSNENFNFNIGIISFLKKHYPEINLPDLKFGSNGGYAFFSFLWFDEKYCSEALSPQTSFFPDTQWFISRRAGYSFAAKGGNNDEPHNHNDIGSFIITVGDNSFIADLGRGEYTKDTFNPNVRYTLIPNGSHGHNVPIINGEYQSFGADFCAKNVCADENSFELDIENAYPNGIINRIHRKFTLSDNTITLCDTFDYSEKTKSVTERFISRIKPSVSKDFVDFGLGKILYNADKYSVSVTTGNYSGPDGENVTVYMTDFEAKNKNNFEFIFEITQKNYQTERN